MVLKLVSWQWRQEILGIIFGRELEISEGSEIQKWGLHWWGRFKSSVDMIIVRLKSRYNYRERCAEKRKETRRGRPKCLHLRDRRTKVHRQWRLIETVETVWGGIEEKKKTGENICLKYCRGVKSEDWYETIGFSIRRTEISEKASSVKHLIWKPDFKESRGEWVIENCGWWICAWCRLVKRELLGAGTGLRTHGKGILL